MIYITFALVASLAYLYIVIRRRRELYELKLSLGLKFIYPNFRRFIKSAHYYGFFPFKENSFIKVKDTREFLEYKFPIYSNDNVILGYYHLGLEHSKKPFVYCHFQNINGYIFNCEKAKLYSKSKTEEIHYATIFRSLISDIGKNYYSNESFFEKMFK